MTRKQRRSDGTFSLFGKRFEVASPFRHFEKLIIRCARWDLSKVYLVDPHTDNNISLLYPQDKFLNATGQRRSVQQTSIKPQPINSSGIAPLLKELMAQFAATGLPPAYIPKGDDLHE